MWFSNFVLESADHEPYSVPIPLAHRPSTRARPDVAPLWTKSQVTTRSRTCARSLEHAGAQTQEHPLVCTAPLALFLSYLPTQRILRTNERTRRMNASYFREPDPGSSATTRLWPSAEAPPQPTFAVLRHSGDSRAYSSIQ